MINKKLSIVIITKNEEERISNCLEEVCKIDFVKKEILLVDSNSTDNTLEIAKKYPIKIINIIQSKIYSPSAGRKIGFSKITGDYILFLDGDQVINLSWLEKYLKLLDKGFFDLVAGKFIHVSPGDKNKKFNKIIKNRPIGEFENRFPGTFLVKNSNILKEENFDPFMRGEEERDFAYRLIKRGYRIYRSKEEMAIHFLKKSDLVETKERIRYMVGIGQLIKKHIFSKFYKVILKDFKTFFLALMLSICLAIMFILGYIKYVFVLLIVLPFVALWINNKFKIKNIFSFYSIKSLLMPIKVFEGILIEIFERREFIYKIEIIK